MSAIYLHIPFCKRLCGYCDFFKSVKLQHLDSTIEAMRSEIVQERDYLGGSPVKTIYFGGGTPSLLSPKQVGEFLQLIALHYNLQELEEVTLEANPDDLSLEYLASLRKVGVNRLSVGVQSFDDKQLEFMNRRHNAAQAIEAVHMAQSVGFDNITIDLIFGVDGFGDESLEHSIATALSLGVQHLSAYHLTIEAGTAFARKRDKGLMRVVEDSVSEREYAMIDRAFVAAGFEHYEVSNYALPGFRSKHNSSYWRGVHYLGIGAGAHSFNGKERRWAKESIEQYLAGGTESYSTEQLSEVDRYNELVMTSLRCCEGVDILQLQSDFAPQFYTHFTHHAQQFLEQGKLNCSTTHYSIPTNYLLLSDFIIESLFF